MPPYTPFDVQKELARLQELERLAQQEETERQERLSNPRYGMIALDEIMKPVEAVLTSKPVKAIAGVFQGASSLIGGAASQARSALGGLPLEGGLSEEGREEYLRETETEAQKEAFNPLAFDVTGESYQIPGAGQVAAEGLSGAGQLAIEAAQAPWSGPRPRHLEVYDPSQPSGIRQPPKGALGTTAKVGQTAAGFALDIPFDPVELRVARTATGLVRAEKALQTMDEIAEAERAHQKARRAYQAAEDADYWSAAASLPATAAGAVQSAQAGLQAAEQGDVEGAATSLTEALMTGAFGVSMAQSVLRPTPAPKTTEQLVSEIRKEREGRRAAIRAGLDQVIDGLKAQAGPKQIPITAGASDLPLPGEPLSAPLPPAPPLEAPLPEEIPFQPEGIPDESPLELVSPETPSFEEEFPEPPPPPPEPFEEDFDAAALGLPSPTDQEPLLPVGPPPVDEGGAGAEAGEVFIPEGFQFFVDDEPQELQLQGPSLEGAAPVLEGEAEAEAAEVPEGERAQGLPRLEGPLPLRPRVSLPRGPSGEEAPGVVEAQDQAIGRGAGPQALEGGAQPGDAGAEGGGGDAGKVLKWEPAENGAVHATLPDGNTIFAVPVGDGSWEGYHQSKNEPPVYTGVWNTLEQFQGMAEKDVKDILAEQEAQAAPKEEGAPEPEPEVEQLSHVPNVTDFYTGPQTKSWEIDGFTLTATKHGTHWTGTFEGKPVKSGGDEKFAFYMDVLDYQQDLLDAKYKEAQGKAKEKGQEKEEPTTPSKGIVDWKHVPGSFSDYTATSSFGTLSVIQAPSGWRAWIHNGNTPVQGGKAFPTSDAAKQAAEQQLLDEEGLGEEPSPIQSTPTIPKELSTFDYKGHHVALTEAAGGKVQAWINGIAQGTYKTLKGAKLQVKKKLNKQAKAKAEQEPPQEPPQEPSTKTTSILSQTKEGVNIIWTPTEEHLKVPDGKGSPEFETTLPDGSKLSFGQHSNKFGEPDPNEKWWAAYKPAGSQNWNNLTATAPTQDAAIQVALENAEGMGLLKGKPAPAKKPAPPPAPLPTTKTPSADGWTTSLPADPKNVALYSKTLPDGTEVVITEKDQEGPFKYLVAAKPPSYSNFSQVGSGSTLEAAKALVEGGKYQPLPSTPKPPSQPGWTPAPKTALDPAADNGLQLKLPDGKAFLLEQYKNGSVAIYYSPAPGEAVEHLGSLDAGVDFPEGTSLEAAMEQAKSWVQEKVPSTPPVSGPTPEPPILEQKAFAPSSFKPLSPSTGGNPGGLYEHTPSGEKFYIKPMSKLHAQNEALAGALYKLGGIRVAETQAVPWTGGQSAILSKIIPNLSPIKGGGATAEDAWKGFGMDAWLGNWDVVGIPSGKSSGNLYADSSGAAVRIDQGGALLFRGLGEKKGSDFGPTVPEIDTLRSPQVNPEAAKVFGKMTNQQLMTSLQTVASLDPQTIGNLVSKHMPGKEGVELLSTLLARQKYIQGKLGSTVQALQSTGAGSGFQGKATPLSSEPLSFSKGYLPIQTLNGIPFSPSSSPQYLLGNISGKEPPLDLSHGQKATAGVVIMEPDGRIWLRANKEGKLTFPKGQLDPGEAPAAGAVREAWEETGLSSEPLYWLGDFERSYGPQRMYLGRRVSGSPDAYGVETSGMQLVPIALAQKLLTKPQDKEIIEALAGEMKSAQETGQGDVLSGFQALAGKPKPPKPKLPPELKVAHFHNQLEAQGLDPQALKKMSAGEWKKTVEGWILKYDSQAVVGEPPTVKGAKKKSWELTQVEKLAKQYKTQKALKAAIAEAQATPHANPDYVENLKQALILKKSKAQKEGLASWFTLQMKNETFRKWWKNSKVANSKGEPWAMFHGTHAQPFGDFDPAKKGAHYHDPNDWFGFYFTPSIQVAGGTGGGNILASVLSIQNPYVVTVKQMANFEFPGAVGGSYKPSVDQVLKMRQTMIDLGYDGIRVIGSNASGSLEWQFDQWVPFHPHQITAITDPSFQSKASGIKTFHQALQKMKELGKQVPLLDMPAVVAAAREKLKHSLGSLTGPDLSKNATLDLATALFQASRMGVRTLSQAGKWAGKHLGDLLQKIPNYRRVVVDAWKKAQAQWKAFQTEFAKAFEPKPPNPFFGASQKGAFTFGGGTAPAPQPAPPGGPPAPPPPKAPNLPTTKEDLIATRKAGHKYDEPPTGLPKGKPTGEPDIAPNLERLGLPDEQTKRLRALMEEIQTLPQGKGGLDRARPEHWEDLDHTIQNLLRVRMEEDWRKIARDRNLRAAEVQAFKVLLVERAVVADAARRRVEALQAAGKSQEAEKAALDYMGHKLEMVANLRAFANDGTAAARALAARRRVMAARGDFEKAIGAVFKTLGAEKANDLSDPEVAQLATLVQETLQGKRGEDELLNALIQAQKPATWAKIMEAWKAGLLSGIATKVANNLGNSTNLMLDIVKDPVAGVFDWARSMGMFGLHKGDRSRYVSDMGAAISALRSSAPQAWKQYWSDWKDATLYRPEKLELSYERGLEGHLPSIGGKTGRFVRSPFRKLQAADDFFKTLFRSMETAREANRLIERWISKGKVDRAQKGKVLEALLKDIYSPEGAVRYPRIKAAAERAAISGTFQDKPGPTGAVVENFFKSPIGKYLQPFAPFIRTPMNIGKATIKLTPAGLLIAGARMKGVVKTSKSMDQLTDDMARALVGTVITSLLIGLARSGFVTGSGPTNDDERKLKLATGWKPNSIVIPYGGKKHYIPMDRFEPLGTIFGIAGDIAELKDLEGGKALFQKAVQITVNQFLNKTYFEGINNAFELASDPERYGTSVLKSLGGSVVPTLVAALARGIDPVYRETAAEASGPKGIAQAIGRTIQARLPYLSTKLPAKRTATGAPAERGGNFLSRFALPTTISPQVRRPVEEELLRVGFAPGPPKRETTVKGKTIRLNDREYRELFKARERAAKKVGLLMHRPTYRALPDTEEEGGSRSKEALIRRLYNQELADARKKAYRMRRLLEGPTPRVVFK